MPRVRYGRVLEVCQRAPVERSEEEEARETAFLDLYGAWRPMEPSEFAEEMSGFDRPWWVVGGWAIEAATGYRREHEDTDVSMLVCDVPAFVEFMKGRWHVWNNVGGVLHPLGDVGPLSMIRPASQPALARWGCDLALDRRHSPDAGHRRTVDEQVPDWARRPPGRHVDCW